MYLKRHIRKSKYDPVVDKVNLVHATPNYAEVQLPSGRETTVSLRDIAPCNIENGDFVYDDELFDESDFVNQNDNTARNPTVMPDVAENDEGERFKLVVISSRTSAMKLSIHRTMNYSLMLIELTP